MALNSTDEHSYRPALDGIRAIAILAVFGYHLGYRWLQGGFLGVDVFFVLSGYLITSLLLAERRRTGGISLTRFWLRRGRRLLPALFVLVAAVALWLRSNAAIFELPLRRADLFWTLFYGANWHLIASAQDYFAQFTSASPLRHAWSLAVEEQFYLVWPLVVSGALAGGADRRSRVAALCGAGVVASAAAMALLYDPAAPSRAYYGTDTRIHQPLIGAMLAIWMSRPRSSSLGRGFASSLAAASAIALLTAFVFVDAANGAYYRGLSIAIAVCAAALIWGVETAPGGALARALALGPARGIGLISYGLYLWHWPVIIAIRSSPPLVSWLPGSLGLNLTRVLVTFAIAGASWWAIEQPIRRGRLRLVASPPRFVAAAVVSTAVLIPIVLWATEPTLELPLEIAGCPAAADQPCLRRRGSSGRPVVALVGDSVARSLDAAFLELAQKHDWTYVLAARSGCRLSHLMTAYEGHLRDSYRACYDETPRLIAGVLETWNPSVVVAMDRFEITDFIGPHGLVRAGTPQHVAAAAAALTDVARTLTSRRARLAFIELPPALPPGCLARQPQPELQCEIPVTKDIQQMPYNDIFRRLPSQVPHVFTISVTDAICPDGVCRPELDGIALRYDGIHFSPEGSKRLAPLLYQRLTEAGVVPR